MPITKTPHRIIHDAFKRLGLPHDTYIKYCRNAQPANIKSLVDCEYTWPPAVLFFSFSWSSSPEDHEFWEDIYDQLNT